MSTLLLAPAVWAQDGDAAQLRELYHDGQTAFDAGNFSTAYSLWNEAYEASGRTLLLVKMADAMEGDGQYAEAILLLDEYRQYAEQTELEALEARIAELYQRQEEAETSEAELRAAERRAQERQRWLQNSSEPPPEVEGTASGTSVSRRGGSLGLEIALAGVTVAALGAGTTLGVLSAGAGTEAEAGCAASRTLWVCSDSGAAATDRQAALALGADISWGVAALAGGAAVVNGILLMTRTSGPVVGAAPLPGGGTLTVAGRFR